MKRSILGAVGVVLLAVSTASALPPAPPQTLQAATDVLNDQAAIPLKCIPAEILAGAHGVAIIPQVIKAGFVFGGRGGHGVVLTRDRTGAWTGPTFIDIGGASFGFQAGVESADVVLVFRTRDSLNRLLEGKGKLTLGVDAAIAAGPVGRQLEAGTDARLSAEIVSYSRSRGLFAGIALNGAAIWYDPAANESYSRDPRPEVRQLTINLLARLTALSVPPPGAVPAVIVQPQFQAPGQVPNAPLASPPPPVQYPPVQYPPAPAYPVPPAAQAPQAPSYPMPPPVPTPLPSGR